MENLGEDVCLPSRSGRSALLMVTEGTVQGETGAGVGEGHAPPTNPPSVPTPRSPELLCPCRSLPAPPAAHCPDPRTWLA